MASVGIHAARVRFGAMGAAGNQVLLWAALCAAGADPAQVTGYGRLFASCG